MLRPSSSSVECLEETWKPSTRKSLSYRPNFGFNAGWAMAKGCFSHQSRLKTLRNRGSHPRAAKLHGRASSVPPGRGKADTILCLLNHPAWVSGLGRFRVTHWAPNAKRRRALANLGRTYRCEQTQKPCPFVFFTRPPVCPRLHGSRAAPTTTATTESVSTPCHTRTPRRRPRGHGPTQ